jgi:hypothetical protein
MKKAIKSGFGSGVIAGSFLLCVGGGHLFALEFMMRDPVVSQDLQQHCAEIKTFGTAILTKNH